MKVLAKEKVKVLAEKFGWSISKAEGYVDGEIFRRRGKFPPASTQVGIDEYALGFRTGYYDRVQRSPLPSRDTLMWSGGIADITEVPAVAAKSG